MKKEWNLIYGQPPSHPLVTSHNDVKQVKFADNDDVMYIYPWSPTKFLLFGKYTEAEIRQRRKSRLDRDNTIIPILKKPECPDFEEMELLEEIVIEETLPKQSVLPSMAVFSPSSQKDLTTNNQKQYNVSTTTIKPIKKKKKAEQKAKVEDKHLLPQISQKSKEVFFGSIRNENESVKNSSRFTIMPSICNIDDAAGRQKPLIKTQFTKRYNLNSDELDDIQNLCEEQFNAELASIKRARKPLPTISDAFKVSAQIGSRENNLPNKTSCKTGRNFHHHNKNNVRLMNAKKTSSTSCKKEVKLLQIGNHMAGDLETTILLSASQK